MVCVAHHGHDDVQVKLRHILVDDNRSLPHHVPTDPNQHQVNPTTISTQLKPSSTEILAWRSTRVHVGLSHETELGATQAPNSRANRGSHDGILLVLKSRPFVHISKQWDNTADITKHVLNGLFQSQALAITILFTYKLVTHVERYTSGSQSVSNHLPG